MKNTIAVRIADFAKKRHSVLYRVMSLGFGICFCMILIPIVYLLVGKFVNQWLFFSCSRNIEIIFAGILGIISLLVLLCSVRTLWTVGRGSPVPVIAPTQKLIDSGPYAFCRNPLFWGHFFYVFAFGLLFGNFAIALVSITLEIVIGLAYLKGIEEKELLLRFGDEYQRYKEKTPFLIPCLKRANSN